MSKTGAMYNNQFEKNERKIRTKAKLYTALVFGSLVAATVYFGNGGSFDLFTPANATTHIDNKKINKKPVKSVTVSKKKRHQGA